MLARKRVLLRLLIELQIVNRLFLIKNFHKICKKSPPKKLFFNWFNHLNNKMHTILKKSRPKNNKNLWSISSFFRANTRIMRSKGWKRKKAPILPESIEDPSRVANWDFSMGIAELGFLYKRDLIGNSWIFRIEDRAREISSQPEKITIQSSQSCILTVMEFSTSPLTRAAWF